VAHVLHVDHVIDDLKQNGDHLSDVLKQNNDPVIDVVDKKLDLFTYGLSTFNPAPILRAFYNLHIFTALFL
jgi:hypothetical protein